MENLIGMLRNAKAARAPQNHQAGVDDLHNQLHALDDAFCQVTKPQTETVAYSKATCRKELWTIFKPLWRHRDDQPVHGLISFNARLQDLRESLRALKDDGCRGSIGSCTTPMKAIVLIHVQPNASSTA